MPSESLRYPQRLRLTDFVCSFCDYIDVASSTAHARKKRSSPSTLLDSRPVISSTSRISFIKIAISPLKSGQYSLSS